MPRTIEISHRTIIFTVIFLLILWLLYQLKGLILTLFIAFIFVSALNPLVDRLERFRLPRWLAILGIYIIILSLFVGTISLLAQPLVEQTYNFINNLPSYLDKLTTFKIGTDIITPQLPQLGLIPGNILKVTLDVFSNLISVVFMIVITFYLLLERKNLNRYIVFMFGKEKEREIMGFINRIENQLGAWVRGEVVLMTVIGIFTYIGLRLLGLEFALTLAIFAGFLEIIPNLGPIISAIPAILLGFSISPLMALAVAALYFLIQQFEGSVIVPKVMERAVGVNPLIIILAIATGLKLAGTVGAILSVPIILIIKVILEYYKGPRKFPSL